MHLSLLYIAAVVMTATLIRSTYGFGEALIAVPLLSLCIPVTVAAPLAVLISITVAGVVVLQDHEHVEFRSALWLVAATIPGIPLGLLLLTHTDASAMKAGLGILILGFSLYSLRGRSLELRSERRVWLLTAGLCAGVLGGAYGMNGPPLAVYGAMRRWSAQRFRATLQGYFFPASALGMAGFWLHGLWTRTVTHDYLLTLPVVLPSILLGRHWNKKIEGHVFLRYVYLGLCATGIALVAEALYPALLR